ncbi:MAG TPA: hypothetical protein VMH79_06140 [Thermoanaerobaculia bacterium]|nr:hypothetical protein [Thermoanaerobaculia bacterium]
MLHRGALAAAVLAAAFSASCASQNPAPPVPVEGSDVSALAGRWVGDYSSTETGRTGSIVFELRSGDKVARGDVLMKPKEDLQSSSTGADALKTMPQILTISFVSATGGTLRGTMDPYRDPSCDCMVQTTFVGRMSGDTIEGTFTTTPQAAGTISTGRWKMTRQKK